MRRVTSLKIDLAATGASVSTRRVGRGRCVVALGVASLGVRLVGVNRTLRAIRTWTRERANGVAVADPVAVATDVAGRVAGVAAFMPGRVRCLEQSLALFALLRHLGIDAAFRIGVRPYGFFAHAWVECNGRPIDEHPETLRSIVPLPEWPL
jgi:hypothetical protein